MRRAIVAAMLAFASPAAVPGHAEAQTQIRPCFVNSSSQILLRQVRFVYRDWQGAQHTDGWRTLHNGERHCRTLQDLQSVRFETRIHSGVSWQDSCSRDAQPGRNATVIIAGTSFNPSCTLKQ